MVWTPREEHAFFDRVLAVVNAFDPYALRPGSPGGPPHDEWESEARAIESGLIKRGRIEFEDVRSIWLEAFGDDLANSGKAVQPFLDALNALVPQNPN